MLELRKGLRERVGASRKLFGRRVFRFVRPFYFFRLIARFCQFLRRVFRFRDVRRAFGDKRSVLRRPRVRFVTPFSDLRGLIFDLRFLGGDLFARARQLRFRRAKKTIRFDDLRRRRGASFFQRTDGVGRLRFKTVKIVRLDARLTQRFRFDAPFVERYLRA